MCARTGENLSEPWRTGSKVRVHFARNRARRQERRGVRAVRELLKALFVLVGVNLELAQTLDLFVPC